MKIFHCEKKNDKNNFDIIEETSKNARKFFDFFLHFFYDFDTNENCFSYSVKKFSTQIVILLLKFEGKRSQRNTKKKKVEKKFSKCARKTKRAEKSRRS